MTRVLILTNDSLFGRTLADTLGQFEELHPEITLTKTSLEAHQKVKDAPQPFDVFLIDQNLGSDNKKEDGIDVLCALREQSEKKTDAIVFQDVTADPGQAFRAYQAGAYRYVTKPIQARELEWTLRSLVDWRTVRFEHSWLSQLTKMAESAQIAVSVRDVAEAITRGGIALGFQRARLWLLNDDGTMLEGISQRGDEGLPNFSDFRMPIEALHDELFQQSAPIFIEQEDDPLGSFPPAFDNQGFIKPRGQWVRIPLWIAEQSLGVLALDYGILEHKLNREQRNILQQFGRQASAALQRARAYEQEQRLHQLGRQIADRAALAELDIVLDDLHREISRFMDAHNFLVVLRDDEEDLFDFRLHIEQNTRLPRQRLTPETRYLVTDVINKNTTLFLPTGGEAYRRRHNMPSFMNPSRCWLGVPMQVTVHEQTVGKAVGALVVQDYEREYTFTDRHRDLLEAIATQVAGSIQTAYLKDLREASRRQIEALHRTSEEIMKLADEREDWSIHATLMAATASFGLRFSRVALFLFEDGQSRLLGHMGMGDLNDPDETSPEAPATLDAYLHDLRAGRLYPSTVDDEVRGMPIDLQADDSQAFRQVLESGDRRRISVDEAPSVLPEQFFSQFGRAEYALLPLRAGTRPLGLVVVDNKHSGIPLRSTSLNYMESLLAQTALTLENVRQRRARSLLIDRTHTIMSMATGERTLSEMLQQICKVARDIMHADCVVIYPLHSSEPPHEYDIANIAAVGLTHDTKPIKDKPRQRGVNAHILKTGTMRVEDTQIDPMVSSHNFILRERIRAFIGSPMRTMLDRRPYGVFYLNYRTPQAFSAQDTRQVESLASLAAVVISNYRTARGTQEQDLQIFSRVLGAALAAEREEDVIRALLDGAQDLLHQHDTRIGLLLLQLVNPANAHYAVRALRREHFLESGNLKTQTKEDPYQGISGHALRTGETQHVTDVRLPPWNESFVDEQIATRSELDVPIKLGNMVIGVFNMESPHVNAFSPQQQQAIERLASEAALALDNVRRQGNLYTVLKAVRALIAPTNLSQTLDAILDAVRSAAPSLSALSIWYREQDDRASQEPETIWRIRQFGMRHHQASTITETPPIVTYMMQTRDPLWAPHIDTVPELRGSFVEQEEIASLAAFPLRFGGRRVGVMFLHYRQEHSFTQEEKALFPILADIAAASIQDAARLREIEQERRRLRAALDISEAVGTTFDLDEILRKIMRVLHELFPGASPCVLTYEPQNNALVFKKASLEFYKVDNPRYQDLRPREPLAEHGEGITGYLARRSLHSRQVEWYVTKGSAKDDPYYRDLILSTQSELCLTLMSGEQLLGVLMLESPEINAFDANDVALVLAVGRQISVALERSYNSEQLEFKNTMIALSAWGAEVSHDINREVGYIRRRVNWLSTEPLSMKGKQYLDEIDYSAEMLAASLPGTEHVHKRAASIDLDEWLVDRIEEMVERQGADVEVQIATNGQEQRVSTHPPTLQRILRHLVRNALRAMGDEGRLLVRTAIYEQQFEIQLEDTGPGIPAYLVPMVFKQKIEADTEGGLGLLIVRTLVENLGGRITLHDPEPGRGAIFTLWLPQEQNTQAEES